MVCAGVLVLFLFLVQSDCKLVEEPWCSKYDFEEKVLEKMVRTEHQMDITKSEMAKSVSTVEKLKEDVGISMTTVDERLKAVAEYLEKVSDFEAKMKDTLHNLGIKFEEFKNRSIETLDGKFEELESRVSETLHEKFKDLNEAVVTPTIAFKARSSSDISITIGEVIVFPAVIFNEGQAYSPSTGIFTVSVSGTYLFTTSFCLKNTKTLIVGIMVDSVRYTTALSYGDANHECNSADTVAVLTAGQKIWVESISGGHIGTIIDHGINYRWNTFSGTLIHQ